MRNLPIPGQGRPVLSPPPWGTGWNPAPGFSDFLALHTRPRAPEREVVAWMEVRLLVIQWFRVSFPPRPPRPAPAPTLTVLQATQTSVSVTQAGAKPRDPVVVDLSGRGPATTGRAGARAFDLSGRGEARPTSMVTGDTAFLALDADGNGRIDSGAELFGDQHGARDGFEELRKHDANGDGRIDARDPVFQRLRLWFGDGRLCAVSEAGLLAISLDARARSGLTPGGDPIFLQAAITTRDGTPLQAYALALNQFAPGPLQ